MSLFSARAKTLWRRGVLAGSNRRFHLTGRAARYLVIRVDLPARQVNRRPLGGFLANQQKGKTMNEKKIVEVLEMIAQDMADDAKNFDGKPFTGRTVAEYFGNQGAAIAALANIIKSLVESRPTNSAATQLSR